jgi:hypothetical protein
VMALPAVGQAQFIFTTNKGAITITGYTGPGGDVVIPETTNGLSVTGIGAGAFFANACPTVTNISSVTIPGSVTNIGSNAFVGCWSMTNVAISSGVITIGDGAFYFCRSLSSVTIPGSVLEIGPEAFRSS